MSDQGWATAGPQKPGRFDATFVAGPRVDSWLEELPESRHQFVLGPAPDGHRQFSATAGDLAARTTDRRASLVLCSHLDPADREDRIPAERITRTL